MSIFRSIGIGIASAYLFCTSALAGISLDNTRLVFPEQSGTKGQTIGVTSSTRSTEPYLVKAQVLANVQGTNTQTPFSVTPSLFRLEIGATNQIRVLKTETKALPNDRESLFFLRVMALPAQQKGTVIAGSSVIVSTGNVIKLFYRPAGFSISQPRAMASLQFSRQGNALKVTNPSPYFITLSSLKVGDKSIDINVTQKKSMIAPFDSLTYQNVTATGKVTWRAINDYGGVELFHGDIK